LTAKDQESQAPRQGQCSAGQSKLERDTSPWGSCRRFGFCHSKFQNLFDQWIDIVQSLHFFAAVQTGFQVFCGEPQVFLAKRFTEIGFKINPKPSAIDFHGFLLFFNRSSNALWSRFRA
jgi:hypothetical protein